MLTGEDGEAAYNTESASIERFDGGFLVIAKNTGARHWHPDHSVRYASWEKVRDEPRDTDPAPPLPAE